MAAPFLKIRRSVATNGDGSWVEDYAALMDGLQDINPESKVGQEIESVLIGLDRLCGG